MTCPRWSFSIQVGNRLNRELRQRGILPLTLVLKAKTELPLRLQAQHGWTWTLQPTDRQLIDEWERNLRDHKFRKLPFRQFQQEVLKSELVKK